MDAKVEKIGNELMALTTAEVLDLQNYLESKGLSFAKPAEVKPEQKEEEVAVVKESENVNLILVKFGSIIGLAKALMPKTGKGAAEIKKLADNIPAKIFENITREVGNAFLSELSNELDQAQYTFMLEDV